jgi:cytochrome b561
VGTEVSDKLARYDLISRALHWLTFALVTAQFAVGWLMPEIGRGTRPDGLVGVHLALGASLLVVVVFRLGWRISHPAPSLGPLVQGWQASAALLTHYGLYLLLIVMSLSGWASASARAWSVKAFGVAPLPALLAPRTKIGFLLGDLHAGVLVWLLLAVIGAHVGAALYHRFVRRDGVLQRMWP